MNELFVGVSGDIEDKRNIPYELVGGTTTIPSKFIYNDGRVNNQALKDDTRYACVFAGEANSINELRYILKLIPSLGIVSIDLIADYAERKGRLDRDRGALLSDGPKTSLELGLIDGYAQVTSVEDAKRALYEQGPIGVGTNRFDWNYTIKAPYVVKEGKAYGHKFIIVGYDDELHGGCFICENSYGAKMFDGGRFYLKYSDFGLLYYTKTVNFINDERFKKLYTYLKLTKTMNHVEFYENYIKNETNKLDKMLKMLASQIRYLGKINTPELKELLK